MDIKKPSRRDLLRATALTGAGLFAGGSVPAFAQNEDMPLPKGEKGTLTVIHRTEYFQQAQDLFREIVTEFAEDNDVALDISTTNPESFGDFLGKMTAAVKAGNPPDLAYTSNVSIPQMHTLGLLEDVTDVVEEAEKRFNQQNRR